MKLVGYGICGPGESQKYLRATLEEFRRVKCDEVIILGNNLKKDSEEEKIIKEFGYKFIRDDREWGLNQNKIKEDFVKNEVSKLNPDWCVCLDMDEILDSRFTKDSIEKLSEIGDAFHFFICDLWNDGWREDSSFWNVRLWQWKPELGFDFKKAPLHCGLAPMWAYKHHYFAPYILKHYGLKDKKHREAKILRYEKYDPEQKYLDKKYYDMLKNDSSQLFNEEEVMAKITKEVETYKQKKKQIMEPKKRKFVYVRNKAGMVLDIPEEHLAITLKQPGMTLAGSQEEMDKEMEELFAEPSEKEIENAVDTLNRAIPVEDNDGKTKQKVRKTTQKKRKLSKKSKK